MWKGDRLTRERRRSRKREAAGEERADGLEKCVGALIEESKLNGKEGLDS